MRTFESLTGMLRARAAESPDGEAFTFLVPGLQAWKESPVTYAALDRRARAIAAGLVARGGAGERVLLLTPPGPDFIAGFFGCLYAGAVAVPAYPPSKRTMPRLVAIARDSGAKLAAVAADPPAGLPPELARLSWVSLGGADGDSGEGPGEDPRRDSLAALQYTSGSTADPKGVMLTHGNLLDNLDVIRQRFEHDERSVVVGWLPPYHDMGLIGIILQPLFCGFPTKLMSPLAFVQRPLAWLQAITKYRGTSCGGPNFGFDACTRAAEAQPEALEGLDLGSWDIAFVGAEPIRADTLDRFCTTFERYGFRRSAFYPCYGLAEATLLVTGGLKADPPVTLPVMTDSLGAGLPKPAPAAGNDGPARNGGRVSWLVGCGDVRLAQRVEIVNPETRERCEEGRVGEVWVSGPCVAKGYWNKPEETRSTFASQVAGAADATTFLRTGDLGFVRDHQLYITGRLKDLLIFDGLNHYPQDIENTVERAHPSLRAGGAAAFSIDVEGTEELGVVQEFDGTDPEGAIRAIRAAVFEHHGLVARSITLVRRGAVPKTPSGKVQRRACRTKLLEGALPVVATTARPEGAGTG